MPESQWKQPIDDAVQRLAERVLNDSTSGPLLPEGIFNEVITAYVNAVKVGIPMREALQALYTAIGHNGIMKDLHRPTGAPLSAQFLFALVAQLSDALQAYRKPESGVARVEEETRSDVAGTVDDQRKPWQRPLKDRV